MRTERLLEALPLAQQAVANARTCLEGHAQLASLLIQLGRSRDADAVILEALNLPTGAAAAYDGLAYASILLNRHERANALYRRATSLAPGNPRYWYNLACSERSFGRLDAAAAACDRCIALDPAAYPTYVLRSELSIQTPDANHVAELEGRLSLPGLDAGARACLGYALAKELDDIGRFDAAFRWFSAAAAARRSQFSYDVAADERMLQRLAAAYPHIEPAGVLAAEEGREVQQGRAATGTQCIFIVGLPRSGTTLLERMLSGLPGVRSNGETHNFSRALTTAAPAGGDAIERAVAADPNAVAAHYARLAGLHASQSKVIEKLPTNYLYLGAIHRALPGARLILVTRSPLDVCFAMFRTLFGEAFPFSYDFVELARYYSAYQALIEHWRRLFGARLHEVVYEQLVRDPRGEGARLAQYCGLTWHDAAIHITSNQSVSLTASAAQVRRPIYGSSTDRWRRYHRQLAPLIEALRRHGVALPADA